MKTVDILLQKYGDKFVPLERIASDYYGVNDKPTIKRMAGNGGFTGLRPFKARNSRDAPYLVDISKI